MSSLFRKKHFHGMAVSLLLAPVLFSSPQSAAQQLAASDSLMSAATPPLPDAPQAQAPATPTEHVDGQSKRILGILPNFRAVDANQHLPPETIKEKFVDATKDSFDYSAIFVPVAVAAYDYERNSTPEFGSGGVGYARYLWHSAADQTIENYMVEFIVPVLTHEDTRFYSLEKGGFAKRAGYALSRVVITRTDLGQRTFNVGEVVGAGASAGISTLYYPSRERSLGNVGSQWGLSVAIDAAGFVVKEFSPEINHALLHGSKIFHLPGSNPKS
jgi:hypothetical protein